MFNLQVPDQIRNSVSDPDFKVFVNAGKEGEPAELLIMEQIGENYFGEGIAATAVRSFVNENKNKDIVVYINSPGGLVFDGLVIYNALANHTKNVTVEIEGLAFSAASFIAMAGDVIRMHEASDIGIHRAATLALGNAKAMRAAAEWLETIDGQLVDIYTGRTGASREQVEQWLDGTSDGTLFSAKEAVEHGFADELIPGKKKAAKKAEDAKAKQVAKAMGRLVLENQLMADRKTA